MDTPQVITKSDSKRIWCSREPPAFVNELFTTAGYELIVWDEQRRPTAEESDRYLQEAAGFVNVQWGPTNAEFFQKYSHLKFVAGYNVGYDHVNVPAATAAKIAIYNIPIVHSPATADCAFMLMMMAARKAIFHYNRIRSGEWGAKGFSHPLKYVGQDLKGKTLGIFGLGSIGLEMAQTARGAFGMKILYHNRGPRPELGDQVDATFVTFDQLLAESDVISIHANLTANNTEQFNLEAFKKMKPTAILVNTARGKLVCQEDLIFALKNGLIWGAGLDVTNPEPMEADNELLTMENVAVLPHIGSATIEARTDMWKSVAENAIAGMQGLTSASCVNPEVYQ